MRPVILFFAFVFLIIGGSMTLCSILIGDIVIIMHPDVIANGGREFEILYTVIDEVRQHLLLSIFPYMLGNGLLLIVFVTGNENKVEKQHDELPIENQS